MADLLHTGLASVMIVLCITCKNYNKNKNKILFKLYKYMSEK